MAAPRISTLTRIRDYAGPFILLSVLTSVAFNRATLARERTEQHRLHQLQMSLLGQLYNEASSSSSFSSKHAHLNSLEEQRKTARRLRTLQLDPLQLGFPRDTLPSEEEEERLKAARESGTTWASALFGTGVMGRMKQGLRDASEGVREQGFGFGKAKATLGEDDEADEEWLRGT
jgi:hypothetical protein